MKKHIIISLMVLFAAAALHAQEERAWYVSAYGDDNDNGRSEERAFRSLNKALLSAAKSAVKKIIICSDIETWPMDGLTAIPRLPEDTGVGSEVFITSGDDGATIYADTSFWGGEFHFENITFQNAGVEIGTGSHDIKTVVTFGEGVRFTAPKYDTIAIEIFSSGCDVTLEKDAEISDSPISEMAVRVNSGTFTMKDDARISNIGEPLSPYIDGDAIRIGSGTVTMQDNAKIEDCLGYGIMLERFQGNITMKDSASITGCGKTGILANGEDYSQYVLQDNASITNCGSMDAKVQSEGLKGGGICLTRGTLTLKDNVVISGCSAAKGGGIYYGDADTFTEYDRQGLKGPFSPDEHISMRINRIVGRTKINGGGSTSVVYIEGSVKITGNTAIEGGGIYAERGVIRSELTYSKPASYHYLTGLSLGKALSIKNIPQSLKMSGGEVSGNSADYGAGVWSGAQEKAMDYALNHRGEVYPLGTYTYSPAFIFSGGVVKNNTARFAGGGIYIKDKNGYKAGAGKTTANRAGDGGNEDIFTAIEWE